jgi:HSP20 family protein
LPQADCGSHELVEWRFYGTFARSFSLPENVDNKAIRAESKDGALYVHIPQTKAEQPRSVQIKVE